MDNIEIILTLVVLSQTWVSSLTKGWKCSLLLENISLIILWLTTNNQKVAKSLRSSNPHQLIWIENANQRQFYPYILFIKRDWGQLAMSPAEFDLPVATERFMRTCSCAPLTSFCHSSHHFSPTLPAHQLTSSVAVAVNTLKMPQDGGMIIKSGIKTYHVVSGHFFFLWIPRLNFVGLCRHTSPWY